MKKILLFIPLTFFLLNQSCNSSESPTENNNIETGDPVENKNPNTNYQPAFEGQTRIGSVKTQTDYISETINESLNRPWGITFLPNGNLLITEKSGFLKIISSNGDEINTIENLPAVNDSGQGGLLDIAVDPDFENNQTIYFTFSENITNGSTTSLAKAIISSDYSQLDNIEILYRATPSYSGSLHYGSRIAIGNDNLLYVCIGERSDTSIRVKSQDPYSSLGSVIRLDKNGNPAANNAFNTSDGLPEIYSYGHRNPQGLAFYPGSNVLWLSEFGPQGGDELNVIQKGKNFGWPIISYGLEYSGEPIGEGITQKDGMEQPVYYWDPSISPSGIDFYTGSQFPEWKNNLFIGALSGTHICRIILSGNKVIGEERLLSDQNERFRDVLATHPDGALYAVTDSGKLYKISKK